jgi:hypothetical protein
VKINNTWLFVLFIQISFGQKTASKEILGQILVQSASVEGVNVLNSTTQAKTVSDVKGGFSIEVKEGDVLTFSAINMEFLQHQISSEDLNRASIQIKMKVKEVELKEVVVNENAHINAENLGIISKNQKKYTAAERKLATAGDFKPISLLGLLGGSMAFDPVLNKINGKTKRLKKNIEVEKKEAGIEQLNYLFEDDYFVEYLKIPSEHIDGFKFYLVENDEIMLLLKDKEKSKLELSMNELALKYNEIILSENK